MAVKYWSDIFDRHWPKWLISWQPTKMKTALPVCLLMKRLLSSATSSVILLPPPLNVTTFLFRLKSIAFQLPVYEGLWTTRTCENSYPRQLVPGTAHTQYISYPGLRVTKTPSTKNMSCPGQLVSKTIRIQDDLYPWKLVHRTSFIKTTHISLLVRLKLG